MYLDISGCVRGLCSDPSPPPPPPRCSEGRITSSSKSLFHLYPPSHRSLGGEEQHKQTGPAFYTSISSLVSSPPAHSLIGGWFLGLCKLRLTWKGSRFLSKCPTLSSTLSSLMSFLKTKLNLNYRNLKTIHLLIYFDTNIAITSSS